MYTDCVTAPEVASSAGAGGLIGTHEAVAIFEVGILVPLDLPGVRVPVATFSNPAEDSLFPAEVGDRPRITVFDIAPEGFIDVTPAVAVLGDSVARVRLQD